VLVTGAAGFLGAQVVEALARRGHRVRALVRPAAGAPAPAGAEEVRHCDLRGPLPVDLLDGVDAVVHLAAQMSGSDEARFAGTVVATERLLDAMAAAGVRRLVLASSYSVYDWSAVGTALDERSPVESARTVHERDAYAVAKLWQERVARRAAERDGLELTVLRPGYVWGPGRELVPGIGQRAGAVQLVFGPAGRLPLTHVENCADCFAAAVDSEAAIGATLNVVDGTAPTTWRYAHDAAVAAGETTVRVPVPYAFALGAVRLVHAVARALLGPRLRLPSIFVPRRFEARFKPVRTDAALARELLGWRAALSYDEALRR
jgi:nucleoside-diphosphate-sugar epimerase